MGTTLQNYCKYAQSHHMIFNYSLETQLCKYISISKTTKYKEFTIIYNRFWKSSIMFCL